MKYPITIYIVTGCTGEYADRTSWEICAYTNEEDAQKHVKLATKAYDDAGGIKIRNTLNYPYGNPYDPNMQVDYTGTIWDYYPLQLNGKLLDPAPEIAACDARSKADYMEMGGSDY